jgi:hypothetical protein
MNITPFVAFEPLVVSIWRWCGSREVFKVFTRFSPYRSCERLFIPRGWPNGGFPTWAQHGWFTMENLILIYFNDFWWMIWGYPHFRKPPCVDKKKPLWGMWTSSLLTVWGATDPQWVRILAGENIKTWPSTTACFPSKDFYDFWARPACPRNSSAQWWLGDTFNIFEYNIWVEGIGIGL